MWCTYIFNWFWFSFGHDKGTLQCCAAACGGSDTTSTNAAVHCLTSAPRHADCNFATAYKPI